MSRSELSHKLIRRAYPYLLLFIAGVLPYVNTIDGPFIWDDEFLISDNGAIRSLEKVPHLFSLAHWSQEYTGTQGQYRPLRALTFSLSYALWGLEPKGYRLTNLAFYVLTIWMVYAMARRLLRDELAALLAALLFAVHPAHTEVTAWVKNRTELMAAIFALLCVWGFWKMEEGRGWGWVVSLLSVPLAVLSKEGAVVLPVILAAWIVHARPREKWKAGLIRILPHGGILLAYAGFMFFILGKQVQPKNPPDMALIERINLVLWSAWVYLRDLFFPAFLNAEHPHGVSGSWTDLSSWASLAALVACGLLWWGLRQRHWQTAFALAWMAISLLPVLNIRFITGRPLADQRVFLASVGSCWMLGYAAACIVRGRYPGLSVTEYRVVAWSVVGVLLSGAALAAYQRNFVWADPLVLYEDTTRRSPKSERAHFNLGNMYKARQEWDRAIQAYRQAIEVNPASEGARNNLGLAYFRKGDYEKAEQEYVIGLKVEPNSVAILSNMGTLYTEMGRYQRAVEVLQRAVTLRPGIVENYVHLADAHAATGHWREAEESFRKALSLEPGNQDARRQLAQLNRIRTQQRQEVMEEARKAAETDPRNPGHWMRMGDLLADKGERREALEMYDRAAALEPGDPGPHLHKGLVLENTGEPDGARREYQVILSMERGAALGNLRLGALLAKEGKLYEAEPMLLKALESIPDEPETHLQLAWVYLEREEDAPKALDHLREALRLAPLHPRREEVKAIIELLERREEEAASAHKPRR
jgi:protein O-mannosyl-transferase